MEIHACDPLTVSYTELGGRVVHLILSLKQDEERSRWWWEDESTAFEFQWTTGAAPSDVSYPATREEDRHPLEFVTRRLETLERASPEACIILQELAHPGAALWNVAPNQWCLGTGVVRFALSTRDPGSFVVKTGKVTVSEFRDVVATSSGRVLIDGTWSVFAPSPSAPADPAPRPISSRGAP